MLFFNDEKNKKVRERVSVMTKGKIAHEEERISSEHDAKKYKHKGWDTLMQQ